MKNRRDPNSLTDRGQSLSGVLVGCLRRQETVFTCSHRTAASSQNDHIVSDELENHLQMGIIVNGPCVVATNNTGDSPNPPVDDIVVERPVRGSIEPSQQIVNRLMAKPDYRVNALSGNLNFGLSVWKVVDRFPNYPLGDIQTVMVGEFNVCRPLDVCPRIGGDEFRMVATGDIDQGLHLTLHIHGHRFDGSGDDGKLLLEEVPPHRDSMTHQDLIRATAHSSQVNPLCPF